MGLWSSTIPIRNRPTAAAVETPENPKRRYLIALPRELRDVIYGYMLEGSAEIARRNYSRPYASLIRLSSTDKFLHGEPIALMNKTRCYEFRVERGSITLEAGRQLVDFEKPLATGGPRLDGIRKLSLLIGVVSETVCEVQRTLHSFVDLLSVVTLRHLHVRFYMDSRDWELGKIFTENHLTPAHLGAFMADPIRRFRSFKGNSRTDYLLHLQGGVGTAWRAFSVNTRSLVEGDEPVQHVPPGPYFAKLRQLRSLLYGPILRDAAYFFCPLRKQLTVACIRGDFRAMEEHHHELVSRINSYVEARQEKVTEEGLGKLNDLLKQLAQALPDVTADTSSLGYAVIDRMITRLREA